MRFWGRPKVPVFLQNETSECALACIAMVCAYHGYETDVQTLRRSFAISAKGANLQQAMQLAHALDLSTRALRCEPEELRRLSLPLILHWDLKHFVVLTKVSAGRYTIHDPTRGAVVLSSEEFCRHFTGVALELTPNAGFRRGRVQTRMSLADLLAGVRGLGPAVAQVFLMAIALEVVVVLAPLFQQLVMDNVVVAADRDLLTVLAVGFGGLIAIQAVIGAARGWSLLYLGTTVGVQLNRSLFAHLVTLPMEYFEKRHLGDLTSRFNSLDFLQRTITSNFLTTLVDGLMVVVTAGLMFVYSAGLAMVSVSALAIYILLRYASMSSMMGVSRTALVRQAALHTNFLESIRALQSIKLFGAESQRLANYERLLVGKTNAEIRTQQYQLMLQTAVVLLLGLENIAVIALGVSYILDGRFSVGMLFAFAAYKLQFSQRASGLVDKVAEMLLLSVHLDRIADIALAERESPGGNGSIQFSTGSLSVENVSFRYSQFDPWILKDFSCQIEEGEIVAIVGASGAGKTTLLKLMLGLLRPQNGVIRFGGSDIFGANVRAYRDSVGTVMQDDTLLGGSIVDNITFFDPKPDEARAREAAMHAAIHDDIERMPMGYNTLIGDMGSALSGGQRQRIILARALYKKPRILFLDEATSHVDVVQERAINERLRRLGITIVTIAHRPETIASARRVIDLGAIVAAARTAQSTAGAVPLTQRA